MSNKATTTAYDITRPIAPVDITSPQFKANPFEFYARLRSEAPVFPVMIPVTKQRAWLVTRYDDALNVIKDDTRFLKNPQSAMTAQQWKKAPKLPPMFKSLQRNLLGIDGADHTRLRSLVHRAFTPRLIEQWRDQIETVTNELLDAAAPKGQMDLVADFALPLPLTMIGRILGVPEEDNPKFSRGMKAFVTVGTNRNPLIIPSLMQFIKYVKKLTKERQAHPRDDLITALVQAKEGNDQMTDDEVLAIIFLLLSAGHETTVNLLGSGTLALLEHPDQLTRLRDNPEPALVKSAVEELVRFVCPAETATERYTTEDVTIAGTTIPQGELVLAVIASANRDATYFENPDTLDLGRQNNKHLSFGQGIHYCIGAPLSRMEGQIALSTLARRMPNLRLSVPPEQLRWRGSFIVRGLEALPVSF